MLKERTTEVTSVREFSSKLDIALTLFFVTEGFMNNGDIINLEAIIIYFYEKKIEPCKTF